MKREKRLSSQSLVEVEEKGRDSFSLMTGGDGRKIGQECAIHLHENGEGQTEKKIEDRSYPRGGASRRKLRTVETDRKKRRNQDTKRGKKTYSGLQQKTEKTTKELLSCRMSSWLPGGENGL